MESGPENEVSSKSGKNFKRRDFVRVSLHKMVLHKDIVVCNVYSYIVQVVSYMCEYADLIFLEYGVRFQNSSHIVAG